MEEKTKFLFEDWREKLNSRLTSFLEAEEPASLYQPMQYVFEGSGKRIRPILLLLTCKAVGGNIDVAWNAALAIELLHNFTLVHDDIMDDDDTRRGRATVHKQWTPNIALLAGDGILALSYKALLRTESEHIKQILEIYTDGIVAVCEGQALDMDFESREHVQPEQYLEMITKKTAYLLNISAKIGAIIGNGSHEQVTALGEFAQNLGVAFQIQDDLLDITVDEDTLGKTFGSDVKQKKRTFLLNYALSHASIQSQQALLNIFRMPEIDRESIYQVRDIFESAGAITAAKESVDSYLALANKNLESLNGNGESRHLNYLLNYISNRNF